MSNKLHTSRREFLKVAAGATGASLLVACGSGSQVESQPTAAAVPTKAVATEVVATEVVATEVVPTVAVAKKADEVSIFFWDTPPLIGIREKALTPFSDASCKLNFTSVPGGPGGGYNDKLFTMLAAGDAPDVFIIEIGELPGLLSRNLLMDLKPYIDAAKYDLSQFPEMMIKAYTHEGGIYGLPDNLASLGLFYNKEMFEEAGAMVPTAQWDDPAWTVDDFYKSMEKLTKVDASGKTIQWGCDVTSWDRVWQTWVRVFGGQVVDDPFYPRECVLNEAAAVEGLQFLFDLRWKYGFAPKPEAMADMGSSELLLSGKLGMLYNGSWAFNNYRDADFTVDIGHYPTGKGGRSNYVYYYPLVVPNTTKAPQCAFDLLKYFNGPAMEMIIKEGGLQGTSLEAQEKFFLTDPLPPKNKQVMVDSVKHFVSPDPLLTNYGEISKAMGAQIDLLNIGEQRDAKVVCDAIVKEVNPLIKKGQWRAG